MLKRWSWTTVAVILLAGCWHRAKAPAGARPRIVSGSPAITDILFQMGLGEHVVAVTGFCILPAGEERPAVGDTRGANAERIIALEPDVICLQQASAGDFEAVRRLRPSVRIEHFRIDTLDEIAEAIGRLGEIAGRSDVGAARKRQFLADLDAVRKRASGHDRPPGQGRPRVLFLSGSTAHGAGTFIGGMIELAGGVNAAAVPLGNWKGISGWKELGMEKVLAAAPDVLVCEVAPGEEDTVRRQYESLKDLPACRAGRIHVVTDRRWTIPSIRSAEFAAALADMIHPAPTTGGAP